jgi:hypothetical protein
MDYNISGADVKGSVARENQGDLFFFFTEEPQFQDWDSKYFTKHWDQNRMTVEGQGCLYLVWNPDTTTRYSMAQKAVLMQKMAKLADFIRISDVTD